MEDTNASADTEATMQKFNKLPKDKQKWIVDQIKKETASNEKPPAKEGTLSGGPSKPTDANRGKRTDKLEKPHAKEEQKSKSKEETKTGEKKQYRDTKNAKLKDPSTYNKDKEVA